MNNRFGTETKKAGSGTEEEFNNAYDRLIRHEKVEIMFYFNDEPIKKSEISDDFSKVNAFKKKMGNLGGYHWTYNGTEEFEKVFRNHITDYFLKLYKKQDERSTKDNVRYEVLKAKFEERLNNALQAFSSQPIIWVEPILSNTNEISQTLMTIIQ